VIIKHITPELKLSDDIAIVGSSGILKSGKFSRYINSHETIIRFNRAPVEDYQEMVGCRTDLRVVNNHVFDNIDPFKDGFKKQDKNFIKKLKNCSILYVGADTRPYKRRGQNTHESNKIYLFDWNTVEGMRNDFKYSRNMSPTIGFIIIVLCIWSGIIPHLYGINTCDRWDHYWEWRPQPGCCHDVTCEKNIYKRLAKEGKIQLNE
jgi:hypothetical protein